MNESNEAAPPQAVPVLALLLDDNLMSSMRVSAQLERMGYTVQIRRAITDSEAALQPGLVVINLGSRGLRGVDLIGAARDGFPGVRVVGFCGHLEVEIRRAAKAAGIEKILTNDHAFTGLRDAL